MRSRNTTIYHQLRRGKPRKRGFTLIELLVVVSIMALVGSLIFVQLQVARARQRDVEREKEIKSLQDALAIYAVNARSYPVYSGYLIGSDVASQALTGADSIPAIPADPLNNGSFRYHYTSADGSTYTLTYYLETDSIPGKSSGIQTASP